MSKRNYKHRKEKQILLKFFLLSSQINLSEVKQYVSQRVIGNMFLYIKHDFLEPLILIKIYINYFTSSCPFKSGKCGKEGKKIQ